MKPEEINRAIAEKCGALENIQTRVPEFDYNGEVIGHHTIQSERYPDYLNDWNALHDALSTMSHVGIRQFADHLHSIVRKRTGDISYSIMQLEATKSEWCEALLRTWGLWKETEE